MGLQDVVSVLESYRGREKTMRTIQYGLLLASPLARKSSRNPFEILGAQIGSARIILRLFDDLSMLQYSLSYGFGNKSEDQMLRSLQIVKNVIDQLFYPVEHIAWLQDMKVLRGDSSTLWKTSLVLWALSLTLTIMRSLRQISILKHQSKAESPEERRRIEAKHTTELLTVIMQASDLLNALNWMPWRPWSKPFPVWQVRSSDCWRPWHRPFPHWQVGLLGLISSLVGFSKLLSAGRK